MFWRPREGCVCGGAKIFGSALLQPARSVCVSSERFFIRFKLDQLGLFLLYSITAVLQRGAMHQCNRRTVETITRCSL